MTPRLNFGVPHLLAFLPCALSACADGLAPAGQAIAVLRLRLALPEELSPQLKASDPTGTRWAQRHEQNFPALVARKCGVSRFEVRQASDFFQAVDVSGSEATEARLQCIVDSGEGYLRLSILTSEAR